LRARQFAFVILDPCEIAGIKPAAALVATKIVFGLVERRTTDGLAHAGAARARFVEAADFHLVLQTDRCFLSGRFCHILSRSKNSGPGINPEARPIRRAVYIRPCCHLDLCCHDGRRCQTFPWLLILRRSAVSASPRWTRDIGPVRVAATNGPRWATRDVKGFRMKRRVANPTEQRCPACDGTGVTAAIQPVQPGRRIYPPPCAECHGKGRILRADK
jgi:hypothetical protein